MLKFRKGIRKWAWVEAILVSLKYNGKDYTKFVSPLTVFFGKRLAFKTKYFYITLRFRKVIFALAYKK
jgi:hypothetical protein